MEQMYYFLNKAAEGKRFSPKEKNDLFPVLDAMHVMLVKGENPSDFNLASGQKATGATGRIALNAYFLLLGRHAFGKGYIRYGKRMKYWAMYLGYHIMRSNFAGWAEKGIYCCSTCTLSVFPLYCKDVFKDFDCEELKVNVLNAYNNKLRPFDGKYNQKYADWSMQFA